MSTSSLHEHLSRIPTYWSILRQAHGGSTRVQEVARAWFMERYLPVVRRYLVKAVGVEAADELAQEFAIRFLEGRYTNANPGRGRFRDYLKTCLFALVADFRKTQTKSQTLQPLSDGWDPVDPRDHDVSESKSFNLEWRTALIDRALSNLEREDRQNKQLRYCVLRFRMDHPEYRSHQAAEKLSAQLGITVNAGWFRKRLMAGRERLALLLLETVAESLEDTSLDRVQEELAELELLQYCRPVLDRLRE